MDIVLIVYLIASTLVSMIVIIILIIEMFKPIEKPEPVIVEKIVEKPVVVKEEKNKAKNEIIIQVNSGTKDMSQSKVSLNSVTLHLGEKNAQSLNKEG